MSNSSQISFVGSLGTVADPTRPTLRQELEERVSLFLRKEFAVPAPGGAAICRRTWPPMYCAGARCQDARDRVLSRQELFQLADSFSRVWLRRADFERLLSKAAWRLPTRQHPDMPWSPLGASRIRRGLWTQRPCQHPRCLSDGKALEALVHSALRAHRPLFRGGCHRNRQINSRPVHRRHVPRPSLLGRPTGCRGPRKLGDRLKQVFVLLAEMGPATLMLEDLNCLAAPSVQTSR